MPSLRQPLFGKQPATSSDHVRAHLLPPLHQASHQAKGQPILDTLPIRSPYNHHGHQLSFPFSKKYSLARSIPQKTQGQRWCPPVAQWIPCMQRRVFKERRLLVKVKHLWVQISLPWYHFVNKGQRRTSIEEGICLLHRKPLDIVCV